MVKVREDMTGWKMWEHGIQNSKLIVIKQVDDYINPASGQHVARWQCQCTCENKTILTANGTDIKTGRIKSCGCLKKEIDKTHIKNLGKMSGEWLRKTNKYDLSGEYGIGWTDNTNKEFYFDLEDYDKIKDYCWSECIDSKGYTSLRSRERDGTYKIVLMHWLFGYKGCDHIDRNPLNNKKSNLRPATFSENRQNSSKKINNTSGFIGVWIDKRYGTWRASIGKDYHRIDLYSGPSKEAAIKARLRAEAKYFGAFAPQRHLFEQYGITIQN